MSMDYRYPGVTPFEDNPHDRLIFYGRAKEINTLFYSILNENLVVLYAKSGIGKTSLINAGLLERLRAREFFPVKIRLNRAGYDPLQSIYDSLEAAAKGNGIDYKRNCNRQTLWHYFKIQEFWSADDILLTPLLIFDQFEEFFIYYPRAAREEFISQAADAIRNRIPHNWQALLAAGEEIANSGKMPDIKILISIREDYLGDLEELAVRIPAIFSNRMKLLPLNRQNAEQAVIEPANLMLRNAATRTFTYSAEAVNSVLDFLDARKKDEIEAFQLQLICRRMEDLAREKQEKSTRNIVITPGDLYGKYRVETIMDNFYLDILNNPDLKGTKGKICKLCEKGIISSSDRRISIAEETIIKDYRINRNILAKLIDYRLLRKEYRLDSFYYELSHDRLIIPIRNLQLKRKRIMLPVNLIGIPLASIIVCLVVFSYFYFYRNAEYYIVKADNIMEKMDTEKVLEDNQLEDTIAAAKKYYSEAVKFNPKHKTTIAIRYIKIAEILGMSNDYEKAIAYYDEVLSLNPGLKPAVADSYIKTAETLRMKSDYKKALACYDKALELNPGIYIRAADGYRMIALSFIRKNEIKNVFDKILATTFGNKEIFKDILGINELKAIDDEIFTYYEKGIEIEKTGIRNEEERKLEEKKRNKHDDALAYLNMADIYFDQKYYAEAIENYKAAVQKYQAAKEQGINKYYDVYNQLAAVYSAIGNRNEALKYKNEANKYLPGE